MARVLAKSAHLARVAPQAGIADMGAVGTWTKEAKRRAEVAKTSGRPFAAIRRMKMRKKPPI